MTIEIRGIFTNWMLPSKFETKQGLSSYYFPKEIFSGCRSSSKPARPGNGVLSGVVIVW